jgi:hypothetical protein
MAAPGEGKLVDIGCYDFLIMEMVEYVVKSARSSDQVCQTLEQLGFRVGQRLAERIARDKMRFKDNLEMIKFLCKDFWSAVYNKNIDNLRTNHRGVFVLYDTNFRWLRHFSSKVSKDVLSNYVVFPCGIIRGALSILGLSSAVTAEFPSPPTCVFTIKIK